MALPSGTSNTRMPPFLRAALIAVMAIALAAPAWAKSPAGAASPAKGHPDIVHVVQSGQYLSLIAKRYHTSSDAIRKANGLTQGATLKPGTVLHIPETPEHAAWRERNEPKPKREDPPARPKEDPRERSSDKDDRSKPRERDGHADGGAKKAAREPIVTAATANAAKWARRPARPGYVVVSRFADTYRGQLRASNGRIVAKAAEKIDWLLRSAKSNEQAKIDRRLVRLLAQVSDHFGGRTLEVVSGFRPYSPRQYTKNSRHNHGEAVDFRVAGVPNIALYEYCLTLPQVGCGYYPNSVFVHLDVRAQKTRWVDYSGPGEAPRYRKPRPASPTKPPAGNAPPTNGEDGEDEDDPEPEDD